MTKYIHVCILGALLFVAAGSTASAQEDLKAKVEELESRVKDLEALVLPMKDEILAQTRAKRLRKHFNERTAKDRKRYSQQELQEISRLYQIANKSWNSPEAKESLKKLIEKYDRANRTGCALLYLGQMNKGAEKEKYLKMAIADFGDCAYGDGVQVGAYARFHLAHYYKSSGKTADAKKLFAEIRKKYPESIDHRGNLLAASIPE